MINVLLNSIIILGNILLFLVLIQLLNCFVFGYILLNQFNSNLESMESWLDDQKENPTTLYKMMVVTSPVLLFLFVKGYIDGRFFTKDDDDDN